MEFSKSYSYVQIAFGADRFDELSGSTGKYTYFRHADGRIVQVNRVDELPDSELREIADQAKIPTDVFLDRINTIKKLLAKSQKPFTP